MKKWYMSKVIFILLATAVPAANMAVILIDSFKLDFKYQVTQAAAIIILVSASSQIINFTVVGALVVRKLQVYFKTRYTLQRNSILKALCLIIAALTILNLRYGFQYFFTAQIHNHNEPNLVLFACLAMSDFIPMVCLIACIQIANLGEWDCLLCNYLRPPGKEDTSTECGSQMLRGFREELHMESLLSSNLMASTHEITPTE